MLMNTAATHKATQARPQRIKLDYIAKLSRTEDSNLRKVKLRVQDGMKQLQAVGIIKNWSLIKGVLSFSKE
jgi:hypothetical protein